jgi:RNA polymerase sigma-70 factor (ECF subfamily)
VDSAGRKELQREMTRLADGDREAFHPVFVRLWPLLNGFAARQLPSGDAEDVAQQALLKLFARASEFDPGRDALSWALGVAAWEIRTARRRRSRRREQHETPERADLAATPEQAAIADDLERAIREAMASLDPRDSGTLEAYARGERPRAVAPPTFRKRVERALGRLRAAFRERHGQP